MTLERLRELAIEACKDPYQGTSLRGVHEVCIERTLDLAGLTSNVGNEVMMTDREAVRFFELKSLKPFRAMVRRGLTPSARGGDVELFRAQDVANWINIYYRKSSKHRHDFGGVYFVGAGCDPRPVKIGFSNDIRQRFDSLRTASCVPLTILGIVWNARQEDEWRFHLRFRDKRYRGEWFWLDGEIENFIETDPSVWRPST